MAHIEVRNGGDDFSVAVWPSPSNRITDFGSEEENAAAPEIMILSRQVAVLVKRTLSPRTEMALEVPTN